MIRKAVILLLLLSLSACPLIARSTDDVQKVPPATVKHFDYILNEGGGITIIGYSGPETNVIVPEMLDGRLVTAINDMAFSENPSLSSVVIPAGIRRIGAAAYRQCVSLQKVQLNDGLLEIGDYAFFGCGSLTYLDIPASVQKIGKDAFTGAPLIPSVYPGSYAEGYCIRNNLPYASLAPDPRSAQTPQGGFNYTALEQLQGFLVDQETATWRYGTAIRKELPELIVEISLSIGGKLDGSVLPAELHLSVLNPQGNPAFSVNHFLVRLDGREYVFTPIPDGPAMKALLGTEGRKMIEAFPGARSVSVVFGNKARSVDFDLSPDDSAKMVLWWQNLMTCPLDPDDWINSNGY